MDEATIALIVMSSLILLTFLGFLIWGIKTKQFNNIEDAKYQVFSIEGGEEKSPENDKSGEGNKKC